MNNKNIHVAASFDINYAKYFINTMHSIIENTNRFVNFYFILDNEETKKYIEDKIEINFKNKNFNYFIELMTREHVEFFSNIERREGELRKDIMPIHYSQLLFQDYFSNLKKFVYIEADSIFVKDFSEIYDIDIHPYGLGAAPTPNRYADGLALQTLTTASGKQHYDYFLGGLTIHDTKYWNENNILDKSIKILEDNRTADSPLYKFYTQGVLNLVFKNKYKKIKNKYNFAYWPNYAFNITPEYCGLGTRESLDSQEELDNVVCFHYNGRKIKNSCEMIKFYKKYDINNVL